MNKTRSPLNVPLRAAIAAVALLLCFSGCPVDDDKSISEVTIYNIPAEIPVLESNPRVYTPSYKIYLNASDSQDDKDPPKVKGVALISDGVFDAATGTYTVTIKLQKPNKPGGDENPNNDTCSWSGTANYYSLMLSPQDTSVYGQNAVWAKGSMESLNKERRRIDWSGATDLKDFTKYIESGEMSYLDFRGKLKALYDRCIWNDPDITK